MAYVAVTKSLIEEVKGKLNTLRDVELRTQQVPAELAIKLQNDKEFHTMLLNRLWEPVEDLRSRLTPYNHKKLSVKVKLKGASDCHTDFQLELKSAPCIYNPEYKYYNETPIDVVVTEADHPLLEQLVQAYKDHGATLGRWEGVSKQVVDFIEKCKSINEAIKLWPDVRRYLPQTVLDRLAKKPPRAEKEESEALQALRNIDMAAVTTSTVIARLAGAQV